MIYAYISKWDNRNVILEKLKSYQITEIGDDCLNLSMKNIMKRKSKVYTENEGSSFFYIVNENIEMIPKLGVGAMAIETETNKNWKFKKLKKEVETEANYYRMKGIILKNMSPESEQYSYIKSNVIEMEELEKIYRELINR
ncbi:MAG: hypothetical protein HUJ53_07050 [Holdemanella sp.]|nr:hypothetical protein [Holdemanella sp.]